MASRLHSSAVGVDLHVPGYCQATDPGAIGAGMYWVDTSQGTGKWLLKVRNTTNAGWETIIGGAAIKLTSPYDATTYIEFTSSGGIKTVVKGVEISNVE